MNGSPSSIIMLGFGNGTFAGSPSLIITTGYGITAVAGVAAVIQDLVKFGFEQQEVCNYGFTNTEVVPYA